MAYADNWMKNKIEAARGYQDIAYHEVNELVFTNREGRLLTLVDGSQLIDFVSCSYLGLDMDPRVIAAGTKNIKACGVTFSAARTRIKAYSFIVLEDLLNQIFCQGHCVIFSSLHLAHLSILPLLGSGEMPSFPLQSEGPLFILDKTVHASIQIQRALMEQFGEVVLVDYNDHEKIKSFFQLAAQTNRTPISVADSIGSMGGIAPINYLFELAERYAGYVYLDDAHGTSIHGTQGCGYVLHALNNTFHPRLILTASLAKAFGAVGGVVILPTPKDVEMMKEFSPNYIFGGPPPLSIVDSAIAAAEIHLTFEIDKLQDKLWDNVRYFDSLVSDKIINKGHLSPVRGIQVGDEIQAIHYTAQLRKKGFVLTVAMYPTVAKHHSILRLALSASHENEEIYRLCEMLKAIGCIE